MALVIAVAALRSGGWQGWLVGSVFLVFASYLVVALIRTELAISLFLGMVVGGVGWLPGRVSGCAIYWNDCAYTSVTIANDLAASRVLIQNGSASPSRS